MKLNPGNVAGSAAILTVGMGAETLLQLIFVMVVSRGLGPEVFGYLGYLLALMTISSTIVHFGLPVIMIREIAQRPNQLPVIYAAAYRIRQALGALFFVAAVVISITGAGTTERTASAILVFFYLLILPFELTPVFDARKLWRWDVPGKLTGRVFGLLLLFVLWGYYGRITLLDAVICGASVNVVNIAVGWRIAIGGGLKLRPFARTDEVKPLFFHSIPVAVSNLLDVLSSQFQIVFVQWLSVPIQTGFYALAVRLILPLVLFKGILFRILLPLISGVAKDPVALRPRLETVFPIVALLMVPLAVLAILLANSALVPLFGGEYGGAIRPFQVAVSHIFFTGFGSLFGTTLLASGDAKTPTTGLIVGTGIGMLSGYLLVPKFGAIGAAGAYWIGTVLSTLYTIPTFVKYCRPKIAQRILRIAAPCVLSLVVNFSIIYLWNIPPITAALISFVIMVGGLFGLGEVSRERISEISELVGWNKKDD